jgi:hypothetical protein
MSATKPDLIKNPSAVQQAKRPRPSPERPSRKQKPPRRSAG